jgi:hypothetical protein
MKRVTLRKNGSSARPGLTNAIVQAGGQRGAGCAAQQ